MSDIPALRSRLSRIADMVDALSRTPVSDLPLALDALAMEVHRAERDCAEPLDPRSVTAADIARLAYMDALRLREAIAKAGAS